MRIPSREFYFIVQPGMAVKMLAAEEGVSPREAFRQERWILGGIFPLKRALPSEGIFQPQGRRAVLSIFQEKLAERKRR